MTSDPTTSATEVAAYSLHGTGRTRVIEQVVQSVGVLGHHGCEPRWSFRLAGASITGPMGTRTIDVSDLCTTVPVVQHTVSGDSVSHAVVPGFYFFGLETPVVVATAAVTAPVVMTATATVTLGPPPPAQHYCFPATQQVVTACQLTFAAHHLDGTEAPNVPFSWMATMVAAKCGPG